MGKIRIIYKEKIIEGCSEKNVYDNLLAEGLLIHAPCGGKGICGKCKIKISGDLSVPDAMERKLLSTKEISEGYRLACKTTVSKNAIIKELPGTATEIHVISSPYSSEEKKKLKNGDFRLTHKTIKLNLDENEKSDFHRIFKSVYSNDAEIPAINPELARKISNVFRLSSSGIYNCILLDGNLINFIDENDMVKGLHSIAIDLGTTTLTASLLDKNGECMETVSSKNPQIRFGMDVISRIAWSGMDSNLKTLQNTLLESIDRLISFLLVRNSLKKSSVQYVGISGNTFMNHTFWGISPHRLGKKPFSPTVLEIATSTGKESGLKSIEENTPVKFLPAAAGFVGSDALAGALWCELDSCHKPTLLIDIGTNGEILLSHRNSLYCCSTAAGPALEGMSLSYGMQAIEGALEKVRTDSDGKINYSVIGSKTLNGICGSGLVSLISWLYRNKVIKKNGNFAKLSEVPDCLRKHLIYGNGTAKWKLTDDNDGVSLNQDDIRSFQLAKAAIRTGIEILLSVNELKAADIYKIYLAGSFGSALDISSTINTGMLPDIDIQKIIYTGNSACKGTALWMLHSGAKKRMENLNKRIIHVSLESQPNFLDFFCDSMSFGEMQKCAP